MANKYTPVRKRIRLGLCLTPALLLSAVGCGFPHDRYASDPLLGNFLRPIAATPPIWTGGDPGVSPAYDGGVRTGLPSPDVPSRSDSVFDRHLIVPTYNGSLGSGSWFRGSNERSSSSDVSTERPRRPVPSSTGAHLMPATPSPERSVSASAPPAMTANSVLPRPFDSHSILTSGAAIEPAVAATRPLSPVASMKDPRAVFSVDEGQAILQVCGAKSMAMEPQPTGEWRFICTINDGADLRRYEAKAGEPIEAVRAVMWQVKNEQ